MVPPELSAEAFRLFMLIPKSRVEGESADGPGRYEPARLHVLKFYETPDEERTAGQCAEYMHAEMIQACAAQRHPGVPRAVAYHLAGTAARGVARTALFAAGKTGELGRLNREMDRIREASGEPHFDDIRDEEKPPEYLALAEQASELLLKIEKMMVIDVLNRYGLHEHAKEFEADEEAFDAKVREGYYVLFPEKRRG